MNAVSIAARKSIQRRGVNQSDIARAINCHRTYVSHIVNGRVPRDAEILRALAAELDDGRLYKALHEALASVAFVHRWLDGDMVDLHRSSVKAKALEELEEAITALRGFCMVNQPKPEDIDKVRDLIHELLGAECAIETLVSILCEEYGMSPVEEYQRFNKSMQEKGYQQPRGDGR